MPACRLDTLDLQTRLLLFWILEGEARDEIKYRTVVERDDPETVFNILKELYVCQKTYMLLQEDLFSRRQLEGESLQEFS